MNVVVTYKICLKNDIEYSLRVQKSFKSSENKFLGKGEILKILLDEMYSGLKEYFEALGWETLTVQEAGLQGAKDRDVVEYALRNNLLLVTQDQKPADLAELLGVKYVLISSALIAKIADEKIREKYPNAH